MHQPTSILMIRPADFAFNPQTADSNAFQNKNEQPEQVQQQALKEFNNLVSLLQANGINVVVIDDTPKPHTPDAIFPNNWISFHENGDITLYPMQAENRRLERREDIIRRLEPGFVIRHIIDLSRFELQKKYLEGTGSMVFDRKNRLAYACLSPRTDTEVLNEFCRQESYQPVIFHASDKGGRAIYHTNVMMCVADKYTVIYLDGITDNTEREAVIQSFNRTGKTIISISLEQMDSFAGNMLEAFNSKGESLLVMSGNAYRSLSPQQIDTLSQFSRIVYADIPVIEHIGGGSVRCMMAEVALPALADGL